MTNLHVFSNGYDSVVAESVDDAWKVWEEYSGESRADYEKAYPLKAVHDEELILLLVENRGNDAYIRVQATAAEWCQGNGRGFLCSTEF